MGGGDGWDGGEWWWGEMEATVLEQQFKKCKKNKFLKRKKMKKGINFKVN